MDPNRYKKRQLSTLHTARLFSSIVLTCGFLFVVASIFLPVLPEILVWLGTVVQSAVAQGNDAENVTAATIPVLPGWIDSWSLFLAALVLIWSGYLLKTVVILAETQLVE